MLNRERYSAVVKHSSKMLDTRVLCKQIGGVRGEGESRSLRCLKGECGPVT